MNKIQTLIAQHCPNGVEYEVLKKVVLKNAFKQTGASELEKMIISKVGGLVEWLEMQEVFDIKNGYTPSKANAQYWTNGTIPWFRMEDIRLNGGILSDSIQHITKEAVKGKLFPADSIIVATTATIGEHALITVESLANQRFTFLSKKQTVGNKLNMKFFYYYMFIVDEWCKKHINASNFASVDMAAFRKLKIPIPPIPVQEEIVRILDAFTNSQTELQKQLQTELELRKKQYKYYRDKLLPQNCPDGWKEYNLKDLGKIITGTTPSNKNPEYWGFEMPFITPSDYKNYRKYILVSERSLSNDGKIKLQGKVLPKDSIMVTCIGSDMGKVAINKKPVVTNQQINSIIPNSKIINNNFLYHRIVSIYETLKKIASGGAVPILNKTNFENISISLPPLEEQKRIVGILDKFDKLVNDISIGIPAEIEMRKKQYEYYRDSLLRFEGV